MAYKPPKQTIVDNDLKYAPSNEAVFEALKTKLDEPSVAGTAGQLLQLDAYVGGEPTMSWVNPPATGANTTLSNLTSPTALNQVLRGLDGTNVSPSYSFTNDTNTGIYSGGSDIIAFAAGGQQRAVLDANAELRLNGTTSGYVGIRPPAAPTSYTVTLPSAQASADMILANNGSGTLSWQFAGLGAGSFGTNNAIVGRSKPTNLTGTQNIILGAPSGNPDGGTATANAITTGNNNLIAGVGAAYALTTGSRNTILGTLASGDVNTGSDNVVIGWSANWGNTTARSDSQNVIIGAAAAYGIDAGNPTQNNSVVVGYQSNSFRVSNSCVVIGHLARMSNAINNTNSASIVLGRSANADNLSNIFTAGSASYPINTAYFGKGALAIAGASLTNFTLTVGRASGTDQSAATGTLTLAGSQGTGTGVGGDVIISTAPAAGLSGSSLNAHVERMRITSAGNVGIGTSTPTAKLQVNGGVLADEYRVANYRLDPHTHDEGTETGNFTINWSNGAVHSVTLNGTVNAVITMNNPVNGGAYALRIIQGATPGTVTWPASVKWPGGTPPTLSAVTGQVDVVNFLYYADTGFYYGTFANNFS